MCKHTYVPVTQIGCITCMFVLMEYTGQTSRYFVQSSFKDSICAWIRFSRKCREFDFMVNPQIGKPKCKLLTKTKTNCGRRPRRTVPSQAFNLELVLDDGTLALRVEVARQAIEMMSTTSARDFAAGSAEQRTELLSGLYGSFDIILGPSTSFLALSRAFPSFTPPHARRVI